MDSKNLSALPIVVVFGAGLLAGRWLPESLLKSNASSSALDEKQNATPTKSQRYRENKDFDTLTRIKRLLSSPQLESSAAHFRLYHSESSALSEEQLTSLITPDEVPDLLAELLQQAGVMGVPKLPNSNYFFGREDTIILRDLVYYYYTNRPDEAIKWIHERATEHERKLMVRMLINALDNKAPYDYYNHEVRPTLMESLRPLAREFPSGFDHWVEQALLMYSARGKTGGFIRVLEFEAEFQSGTLRDDWTLEGKFGFNYTQAINEFTRINQTLDPEQRMTLPSNFHSQWGKKDAEGARAWRSENPDWSSQE